MKRKFRWAYLALLPFELCVLFLRLLGRLFRLIYKQISMVFIGCYWTPADIKFNTPINGNIIMRIVDGMKKVFCLTTSKITLCVFLLLVAFSSCLHFNKTKGIKSAEDSIIADTVSDSLIVKYEKEKEYYRQASGALEEIIAGLNSFDYVPINAKTTDWYKRCREELVMLYNSNKPAYKLTDNEKIDSLLRELEGYYELYNDEYLSKYMGIPRQRLKKCIILYRITEKTLTMQQRDSTFLKEQIAWESMQRALEKYYITAEEILYTGGTGNVVLCMMAMNDIYESRICDLERMQQCSHISAREIRSARDKFVHLVDSIEKELNDDYTKGEWNEFKDIVDLLDEMHKARIPLITALDLWIAERKRYGGCEDSIIDLYKTISGVC